MNQADWGWKGDVLPILERISKIATGGGSLTILAANPRLALGLPKDRKAAASICELYQPQRIKGRIFKQFAKIASSVGLTGIRPTFRPSTSITPLADWMGEAAKQGTIGFLGCNPNHGPRCVIAGIHPSTGKPFVAKLGLDGSAGAIQRESIVLEGLHGKYPGVIPTLGILDDGDSDWALLRLPHLGNESPTSMNDPMVHDLLVTWLGEDSVTLENSTPAISLIESVKAKQAPEGWHERMRSHFIRTALSHGDFAVWNLRRQSDGLVAMDWEWAQENSVAGIDLAHGLRQESHLVMGLPPQEAVKWILKEVATPKWSRYLEECGWAGRHKDWLSLGLLHSHFITANPSHEALSSLGIDLTPH